MTIQATQSGFSFGRELSIRLQHENIDFKEVDGGCIQIQFHNQAVGTLTQD